MRRRVPVSLATLVTIGLVAVCSGGAPRLLSAQERAMTPLDQATVNDLAEGKRWFDSQCALCHGIGGVGGSGPLLRRPTLGSAPSDADLVQVVRQGIPGTDMPSFMWRFTVQTAWQVAAYVRSLGRVPAEPANGDAAHGAQVYADRGCASCHVLGGHGEALGPELTRIGTTRGLAHLRAALIDPAQDIPRGHVTVRARTRDGQQIQGVRIAEDVFWLHLRDVRGRRHSLRKSELASYERQLGVSLMPSYASILTERELDDLVAYLSSLRGTP